MRRYRGLVLSGLMVTLGACSSSNGLETNGAAAVGGSGAANAQGGAANSANAGGAANAGVGAGSSNGGAAAGNTAGGSISVIAGAASFATGGTSQLPCGADACAAANANCGSIIDGCGVTQECGTCAAGVTCGSSTPNQCGDISCTPLTACPANFNCGYTSDGCTGILNCGGASCTSSELCISNVCTPITSNPGGATQTCIAGTLGCLCNSTGACAAGLTCTTQTTSGVMHKVCCDSTGNCTPPSSSIGSTCAGTGTANCTPGVTIPTATSTTDNCGYPATSFNENAFMCGIYAQGGGAVPAQIQAYFNDEWPLTLGCTTAARPVSTLPSDPGAAFYPQLGDPNCNDTAGRPMRPTLYITDITSDPNCKAGDQQAGGTAYDPIAVFGTWTYANNGTPVRPTNLAKNYWTLGAGSDLIPDSVNAKCPCSSASNCPGSGLTGKGYGAEVRYEAGLISGHSYRLQVMGHDGDQTQGGDSGEACVIFCAGNGVCPKMTCADYPAGTCGQQSDNCGGIIDCPCQCVPKTCQDCPVDATGKPSCLPTEDVAGGYIYPCPQSTGCQNPPTVECWCPIG
jgi:hypothetical protein